MENELHLKCFLTRRRLAAKSVLLGIVSGLVAVMFRIGLEKAEHIRVILLGLLRSQHALMPSLVFAVAMAAILIALKKWAPEASGSGIPHLKGVLKEGFEFRAVPVLLVKFFGGLIGIGAGLALGREGPTVQMGSAVGDICARIFKSSHQERVLMLCAGAGAGLASAFNAPLAGLLFIIEELQQKLDRFSLVVAFSATISANLVCRLILGQSPIFQLRLVGYPDLRLVLWSILFGVAIGFVGLAFNRLLIRSLRVFGPFRLLLGILLGILFGFTGYYFPDLLGTGHRLTENVFLWRYPLKLLAVFLLARFLLTLLSYNTGAPGGIFAPILLLGALCGGIFQHLVNWVDPGRFDPMIFLVLGMAGMFSAVVRGPLTGTVLIMEMTNEFMLLLPLMIVSIMAYAVPEFAHNKPIYDELLDLDLARRRADAAACAASGGAEAREESPDTGLIDRE
ncbi:MAG TPA: H(+)/Cl(-) exchange transporter ClcA [Candidatus Rifleibacterium sp.]|nr:H(+)/Cl(-) exchange transporter ClcA [Candidatus Rifleibacterium sp.]HOI89124.1 H(+)/Cl(-) exchange transporter ClcA [Candidatus Rifleibacterium sp.]